MNDLSTVVSRYNASLNVYTDTQFVPIATDKHGRILFSHAEDAVTGSPLYSSVRIGDGTDLLDVLNIGDAVAGNTGILIFGEDGSGNAVAFPILDGLLQVGGSVDIDPTPGVQADKHSDEAGAQTEPGVIPAIGTGSWVDIVSIDVLTGQYVAQAIHAVADRTCQFRLIIEDNALPTVYLGNWMVTQNIASYEFTLPRAREITGQALRKIKLQAIRRAIGTPNANASGRINGFTR